MFWHSTVPEMGRGLLDWREKVQKSKQRPFHQLFATHSAWIGSPVLESEPSFNLTTYFVHLFLERNTFYSTLQHQAKKDFSSEVKIIKIIFSQRFSRLNSLSS